MSTSERIIEWADAIEDPHLLAEETAKFIAHERANHEEEFFQWLIDVAAETCVMTAMRSHQQRQRSAARNTPASKFEAASKAYAAGDKDAFKSVFAVVHAVTAENLRKPVAQMTGLDHLYVADYYRNEGKRSMMLDSFHRIVAKKVGARTTAEVFNEGDYARIQHWFLNGRRKDVEHELGS